jgi:anti-sigma B factor antagonist
MASAHDISPIAPLDIAVSGRQDTVHLTLTGEIDVSNADRVLACAQRQLNKPQVTRLIVDLARVGFIDSSGLHTLVRSRRHADDLGKMFRITGHHGHVATVIEITGLTGRLTDPNQYGPPPQ